MIFLLGNGFDLGHGLPSKYENFLHVVNFLIKHYENSMETVGSILGDERLHKIDDKIGLCYSRFGKGYDKIPLTAARVQALIDVAQQNEWYRYFSNSLDEDIGWIDFEKEISEVVHAFADFLPKCQPHITLELEIEDVLTRHFVMQFDFFHDQAEVLPGLLSPYTERRVKSEYCYEYPKGSGNVIVNAEKIMDDLWHSLEKLSVLLKEYLQIFVDETLDLLISENLIPKASLYDKDAHVITFNYTHTFEKLYGKGSVKHIHGQVDNEIVLGINPDGADDVESVDTSFLPFKKYYQRVRYNTDIEYLSYLEASKRTARYDNGNRLIVVGHSLDVTDKDIIIELFDLVKEIHILYHSERNIGPYIKNLVKIYGKAGFDDLRSKKKLRFLPLKNLFE